MKIEKKKEFRIARQLETQKCGRNGMFYMLDCMQEYMENDDRALIAVIGWIGR